MCFDLFLVSVSESVSSARQGYGFPAHGCQDMNEYAQEGLAEARHEYQREGLKREKNAH